ncbi:hypothetical protein OHD16_06005 [Sphingobacterium sp. ML3W]|uniref:hypothetical protein n=1 Tax=Sphingobacterium sp. ML3W TaxID=1538644 RepID=UPI002499B8AB|nr:hypothetical protein [Sphingobacterium sp. ML3W]WFA79520.1 hypothetical protein OGI71_26245 [Sphingobacterium sp. ML3W]
MKSLLSILLIVFIAACGSTEPEPTKEISLAIPEESIAVRPARNLVYDSLDVEYRKKGFNGFTDAIGEFKMIDAIAAYLANPNDGNFNRKILERETEIRNQIYKQWLGKHNLQQQLFEKDSYNDAIEWGNLAHKNSHVRYTSFGEIIRKKHFSPSMSIQRAIQLVESN